LTHLVRVAALLTSHNRREETLHALERLHGQHGADADVRVYLVDAGSTDGTAEAVAARFPEACVIVTGDDVFWNAGMRIAFAAATNEGDATHYLWLNDDTRLDEHALAELLATERLVRALGDPAIVVGAVRDPETGELTYGGVERRSRWRPLRFSLVPPGGTPKRVETMNGNVVLLSAEVVDRVGLLDPGFSHGMGDYDYGLRANRTGVEVWMASGTVGVCARNAPARAHRSLREELERLRHVKALPPGEWFRFARRWAGPLWPLYGISPYIRRLAWAWGSRARS
jgi:GT2 family glycosyltransferase